MYTEHFLAILLWTFNIEKIHATLKGALCTWAIQVRVFICMIGLNIISGTFSMPFNRIDARIKKSKGCCCKARRRSTIVSTVRTTCNHRWPFNLFEDLCLNLFNMNKIVDPFQLSPVMKTYRCSSHWDIFMITFLIMKSPAKMISDNPRWWGRFFQNYLCRTTDWQKHSNSSNR